MVIAMGIYSRCTYGHAFAAVLVLVILLARVLGQMGKVQKQYQKLVTNESAFWSYVTPSTCRAGPGGRHGNRKPKLESGIRFGTVSFAYGEKTVLQKVSMRIPAKSLTTIIGSSGAGKTTLVDLVIGLYQPDGGTVYLDDMPLTSDRSQAMAAKNRLCTPGTAPASRQYPDQCHLRRSATHRSGRGVCLEGGGTPGNSSANYRMACRATWENAAPNFPADNGSAS